MLTAKGHQSATLLALCEGNPPYTGGFPSQRASNMVIFSLSWHHHDPPLPWSDFRKWAPLVCLVGPMSSINSCNYWHWGRVGGVGGVLQLNSSGNNLICILSQKINTNSVDYRHWTTSNFLKHEDIVTWKHFLHYWPFMRRLHLSFMASVHEESIKQALMFYLVLTRTSCWINSWVAGDLRWHDAHTKSL